MVRFSAWHWFVLVAILAILFGYKSKIFLDDLTDSIRAANERLYGPNGPGVKDRDFHAYSRAWLIVLAVVLLTIVMIYMADRLRS